MVSTPPNWSPRGAQRLQVTLASVGLDRRRQARGRLSRSNVLAVEVDQEAGVRGAGEVARRAECVQHAVVAEVRVAHLVGARARGGEDAAFDRAWLDRVVDVLENVALCDNLCAAANFESVAFDLVPVVVDCMEESRLIQPLRVAIDVAVADCHSVSDGSLAEHEHMQKTYITAPDILRVEIGDGNVLDDNVAGAANNAQAFAHNSTAVAFADNGLTHGAHQSPYPKGHNRWHWWCLQYRGSRRSSGERQRAADRLRGRRRAQDITSFLNWQQSNRDKRPTISTWERLVCHTVTVPKWYKTPKHFTLGLNRHEDVRHGTRHYLLRTVFSVPANVRRRRLHSMKRGREGRAFRQRHVTRSILGPSTKGLPPEKVSPAECYPFTVVSVVLLPRTVNPTPRQGPFKDQETSRHLESKQRSVAQSNDVPLRTELKCQSRSFKDNSARHIGPASRMKY
ncbi:putative pectin lyase [Hortaea werneckii]|nr:putative pectin lyase [Hortaea werneckii]